MNKVICNLCGTSYPENAPQCPICGQVRSTEEISENTGSGTYTYVKGGRFSKANVKKRNRASGTVSEPVVKEANERNTKKNSGLIVIMIVLLLAIVLVLGYIAVQLFVPDGLLSIPADKPSAVQQEPSSLPELESTEPSASTEPATSESDLKCKSISLNTAQIELDTIGATAKLTVKPEPADTTDQLLFSSSDPSVAAVSTDGTVTAIGSGSAVITVTCGSARAECSITCEIPGETTAPENEAAFSLNRKEITFNQEGQSWLVYDGDIAIENILWISDDSDVATIENGRISAVGNGDTTVYGIYDDQTVSCIIHCDFTATGESGGITEAGGSSTLTYKLYNPVGYADDVTIYVGDQFPLQLVDANENEVTGVQWTIADDSVCTYVDGIVEATNLGTTEITATYDGASYVCTVRVIEE